MNILSLISSLLVAVGMFFAGVVLGGWIRRRRVETLNNNARECGQAIIAEARNTARRLAEKNKQFVQKKEWEAKDRIGKFYGEKIEEANRVREEQERREKKLEQESAVLSKRGREMLDREASLRVEQQRVSVLEKKCRDLQSKWLRKLEQVSEMSLKDAKAELMKQVTQNTEKVCAKLKGEIVKRAKEEAESQSREILLSVMERYAGDLSAEHSLTIIKMPGEDMKGKIIGKEGRNIKAIESAAGVNIVIDDGPDLILISSFDPLKREIAARAINRLMDDGKIHPAAISEALDRAKKEKDRLFLELGETAAFEIGVEDLDPRLVRLVGSLKFRHLDFQNLYTHSLEVAYLAGMIAAEIGVDPQQARRAGLLHDVGRAIQHRARGNYSVLGAEFAEKCGESSEIVKAIADHRKRKNVSVLTTIVQLADKMSKMRPGARKKRTAELVTRLEKLETHPSTIEGVEKAFVLQSGKLCKVLIESTVTDEEQRVRISQQVEDSLKEYLEEEVSIETRFSNWPEQTPVSQKDQKPIEQEIPQAPPLA